MRRARQHMARIYHFKRENYLIRMNLFPEKTGKTYHQIKPVPASDTGVLK